MKPTIEPTPGATAPPLPLPSGLDPALAATLTARWEAGPGAVLAREFTNLYGHRDGAADAWNALLSTAAGLAARRDPELHALDAERAQRPDWFLDPGMLGYSTYVDRFGGGFSGVTARIDWLQGLGVRYLHLLPFLRPRDGDNDGGFAVSDYDEVDPRLGTMDDLVGLARRLRASGISLGADLVLNHTADDHAWAVAARAGDPRYRAFYHVYPDREVPDRFEATLPQIFPLTAPGNFTHDAALDAWVWTTFYPFQWDLDWSNPDVFVAMAATLLRTANRGVEVLRLDSIAFLWKRQGTDCMNQPEVHAILRALRALVDVFAPGVLLKAEAIVPMRDLPPYFGGAQGPECHLAYHSSLMTAAWASLALGDTAMLRRVLRDTPTLGPCCSWLTYVRCHDDIGWKVLAPEAVGGDREPPVDLGWVAGFYAGSRADSFADGRPFQSADGGVHGTSGMAADLCGIGRAQRAGDPRAMAEAVDRLLLLYGVAMCCGGLPTLYMGDEIALGNDLAFDDDPGRRHEGRWLHRPAMDWERAADPHAHAPAGVVLARLRAMVAVRRDQSALHAAAPRRVLDAGNPSLLVLARGDQFIGVFNFGPRAVRFAPPVDSWHDLLDASVRGMSFVVRPWGQCWLERG
ncbi:MAG: amylosucrase [Xanthomonadaceae bacterium]|jgi:amylosucrase|nr:amylosucrase [Xanthomonadaceae bacterium]